MKIKFLRYLPLLALAGGLLGIQEAAAYTHVRKVQVGTRVAAPGLLPGNPSITATRRGLYAIYSDSPDLSNGTRTTNIHALRIAVNNTLGLVGDRIESAITGQALASKGDTAAFAVGNGGISSGNMPTKWGVWGMVKYTRFDITGKVAPNSAPNGSDYSDERYDSFKGNMWTGSLGADYKFNERFLAGLGFAFDYLDAKTKFNEGKVKNKNYTIAPYAAFVINKYLYLDTTLGYSYVDKTTERQELHNFSGQTIKGSPKADRFFGALYLNAHKMFQEVLVHLSLGYRHMNEKQKAFQETPGIDTSENVESITTNLGNADARLKLGYRVNEMALPYLLIGGDYDVTRSKGKDFGPGIQGPKTGRLGYTFGLGIDFKPMDQWSGSLEGTYQGRQDKMKVWSGTAKVRYQF